MRRLELPRQDVVLALLGGIAGAATEVGYLMLLNEQGTIPNDPYTGRVFFIALFVGGIAMAGLAAAGLLVRGHLLAARILLAAAATGAGALGVLALFSIGVALLLTSVLLAIPAMRAGVPQHGLTERMLPVLAIGTSLLVLAGGFTLTGGL